MSLHVTSQIVCEFYSLITNPKRTAIAWSSAEAVQLISELLAYPGLTVLPTPAQAVTGLLELLKRSAVTGSSVFDLQIVATMLANGILRIYTFNTSDFEMFKELTVAAPR